VTISAPDMASLQGMLAGEVVVPGSLGYESARKPALARCSSSAGRCATPARAAAMRPSLAGRRSPGPYELWPTGAEGDDPPGRHGHRRPGPRHRERRRHRRRPAHHRCPEPVSEINVAQLRAPAQRFCDWSFVVACSTTDATSPPTASSIATDTSPAGRFGVLTRAQRILVNHLARAGARPIPRRQLLNGRPMIGPSSWPRLDSVIDHFPIKGSEGDAPTPYRAWFSTHPAPTLVW
jgi:hypothetical protein